MSTSRMNTCLYLGAPLGETLRHRTCSGVWFEFKPQLPTCELCELVRLLNVCVLHGPHPRGAFSGGGGLSGGRGT